jgi:hypothetical protein
MWCMWTQLDFARELALEEVFGLLFQTNNNNFQIRSDLVKNEIRLLLGAWSVILVGGALNIMMKIVAFKKDIERVQLPNRICHHLTFQYMNECT